MSEHEEQVKVIQWARGSGLRPGAVVKWPCLRWLYSIPNGIFLPGKNRTLAAKIMAKMKREGLTKGISDLCLPHPSNGYHGLYIELKWKDGKPSTEQKEFLLYADSVGYFVKVCYTSGEAIAVIEEYLQ